MPEKKKKQARPWKKRSWNVEEAGHKVQAKIKRDYAKHHSQFGGVQREYLPKQVLDGFKDGMARVKIHIESLSDHPVTRYRQLRASKVLYNEINQEYRLKAQQLKDPEKTAEAINNLEEHSDFFHDGVDHEMRRLEKEHKKILKFYTASDLMANMDPKEAQRLTKNLRALFTAKQEAQK